MALDETAIRRTILELLVERGEGKTICPSEAARALDARGFRDIMPAVRAVAQTLVEEGRLEVTQRGRAVDIRAATGPVRLRTLP